MDKTTAKKYYNIEALRFILAVIIVFFHILNKNIIPFTNGQEKYIILQKMSASAKYIVECFLVISGYFLYGSFSRRKNSGKLSFIEFTVDKIARLWPVLAFYILLSVIFRGEKMQDTIMDLCFLRCVGIFEPYKEIIWYVSPFFWGSLFVYGILMCFDKKKSALILSIMAYFGYAVNLNTTKDLSREVVLSFVSLGLFRVIAGISVGVIIAIAMEAFIEKFGESPESKAKTARDIIAELILLAAFLIYCLIGSFPLSNPFSVVIIFSMLFIVLIKGNGLFSKLTDHKFFSYLGRYSYSIYVMQQMSFLLMSKTFWTNTDFLYNHALWSCIISVLISVLCGVATYHLIEEPAVKLYKKWKGTRTPKPES